MDVAPAFSTTKAAELVVLGGEILRVRAIETRSRLLRGERRHALPRGYAHTVVDLEVVESARRTV